MVASIRITGPLDPSSNLFWDWTFSYPSFLLNIVLMWVHTAKLALNICRSGKRHIVVDLHDVLGLVEKNEPRRQRHQEESDGHDVDLHVEGERVRRVVGGGGRRWRRRRRRFLSFCFLSGIVVVVVVVDVGVVVAGSCFLVGRGGRSWIAVTLNKMSWSGYLSTTAECSLGTYYKTHLLRKIHFM